MLVDADYDRKNNGPDNAHGQACVEDDLPRSGRKHVEESDANECQERLDDERRRADGHALLVRWRYPVIARSAIFGGSIDTSLRPNLRFQQTPPKTITTKNRSCSFVLLMERFLLYDLLSLSLLRDPPCGLTAA